MKSEKIYPFKPIISLRISGKLLQQIDQKAKEEKINRSIMINKILKESFNR